MVWLKNRTTTASHLLHDSVRGTGSSKSLHPNHTPAQGTLSSYGWIDSFDSNGFSVAASSNGHHSNRNGDNYIAWAWKAGGGTPTYNTTGSINSIVSANSNAGFSIVKYTGGGGVATIGHGLSAAPEMVIVKSMGHSTSWYTYHAGLDGSSPEDYNVRLNEDAARQDSASYWNDTAPTNSVFTIGTTTGVSQNNTEFIAYCFHSVTGYSKIGSYTGATAGVTITTGFQPDFVMIKSASNVEHWAILDSTRGSQKALYPNRTNAESNTALHTITFSSTGFSFPHQDTADAMLNENGYTYIYAAFKIN